MMKWLAWCFGAFLLAGCSANGGGFTDAGGDARGLDAGPCQQGQATCQGAVSRVCDGHGGFTGQPVDCSTMGMVCAPGIGCSVCAPNAKRCSPDDATVPQVCATDGSGWNDGTACDATVGLYCMGGECRDRCNPVEQTYLGCEYWPTVTVNSQLPVDFHFYIVVSNPQTYDVTLGISGGALTTPIMRTLTHGTVTKVQLPWVDALSQAGRVASTDCAGGQLCIGTSALAAHGAYHLTTNGPVAVYQFNPLEYRSASGQYSRTADASLLLPTRVLTGHYIAVTHDNWTDGSLGTLGGFISIVGTQLGTTHVMVNLTASVSAGPNLGAMAAGPQAFQLGQGDVVQLVGSTAGEDLTGTTITADNPVAVFTGHDCAQIPVSTPACDHLEEQLFPNETWGKHYAVTQQRDRGDTEAIVVRIVSEQDGNTLSFDGIATPAGCATLNARQKCEFTTTSSFQVTGTVPFLVMQFMVGQGPMQAQCTVGTDPPDVPACEGDPDMVTEVPVEQFRQSYDFLVPGDATTQYPRNFVNVVYPSGIAVTLDGTAISGSTVPVGSNYLMQVLPIQPGAHHIETANGQGFGIKVYGIAPYTSYTFPGGLDLAQIAPPG